jgi:tetratricopeptide (TPR) repeat protein
MAWSLAGLAAGVAAAVLVVALVLTLTSHARSLRQGVNVDLAEATRLREQGRYAEARAVLGRAEQRLAGGKPTDLAESVRQAMRDLDLALRLEEIPLLAVARVPEEISLLAAARVRDKGLDRPAVLRAYQEAFASYGIDLDALAPAEAAERIRASAILEPLVVALDHWAALLIKDDDGNRREHLLAVARLADRDESRAELRRVLASGDQLALEELAGRLDARRTPPTSLYVIGQILFQLHATARAEAVLRRGQQVHPSNFWFNFGLYVILREIPSRHEEAVSYLRAAVALRPESPGARYSLGSLLFDQGKLTEAEQEFREALRNQPDFAWVHNHLGVLLASQGKLAEAEAEYRAALHSNPDDATDHTNLGFLLHGQGKTVEAEGEYRAALRCDPDFAGAHNNLGVVLAAEGKTAEAEAEYRDALRGNPDYAEAHTNLGNLLFKQGKLAEAEIEYRTALCCNPELAGAHYGLGYLLAEQGKAAEAEQEFRVALHFKPDFAEAHTNLGVLLGKQGKLAEEEAEYRAALRCNPDLADAHASLGHILLKEGKLAGAETEYRVALSHDPDLASAHYGLGVILDEERRPAEAEIEYRAALRCNPDLADAHASLGKVLAEQRKTEEAGIEYRAALRIKPNDTSVHYNFGILLAGQERLLEAEQEYRAALRCSPNFAEAHTNLGFLLAGQGKLADAEKEYRAALLSKPSLYEARHNLGLLLEGQGKFTPALEELQRAEQVLSTNDQRLPPVQVDIRRCQALADLDRKLPDLLQNKVQPVDAAEALAVARLCQQPYKQLCAAGARFYADAFAAEPRLADDLPQWHRYNAGCNAVLASCGKGNDASLLDDKDRLRLRRQALAWLRSDLDAWAKLLDSATSEQRAQILGVLKHWQEDSDLAGVRDKEALEKLPEGEREAWRTLWAEVEALRQKAAEKEPR